MFVMKRYLAGLAQFVMKLIDYNLTDKLLHKTNKKIEIIKNNSTPKI